LMPPIVLIVGALVELVVAFVLNRHGRLFDREREDLRTLHREEMDLVRRELELAVKGREMTEARLRLRESLVREERAFLLLQLEMAQRATRLSNELFIPLDPPQLSSEQVEALDQILNRLERIETADQAMGLEQVLPETERKQRAYDLLRLGNIHYYLRHYRKAIAIYDKVLDMLPADHVTHVNRGMAHLALGEQQLAIEDFDRALRLAPDEAHAYHGRGAAYETLEQPKKALDDYNKAIRLDPKFADAYYSRGVMYEQMGQHEKAFQDLDRVIELNPGHARAYSARGITRKEMQDYQWAMVDFGKAFELDPDLAEAYSNRGQVHMALAQYEEAVVDFNRAIALLRSLLPGQKPGLRCSVQVGRGATRSLARHQPGAIRRNALLPTRPGASASKGL
jgi:tetratricopeptide (TPR) repeat protein